MSQPAKKCEFCQRTDLTKSHIWPDWAQKIVPAVATHYEIKEGGMATYKPRAPGPTPYVKVKTGAVAKRRPRNTCTGCNGGWMREIEEAAIRPVSNLMRGQPFLLTTIDQRLLATFLCLVSVRIALASKVSRPIPLEHHQHLISRREPPIGWRVWIVEYVDEAHNDYWYGYFPMAMMEAKEAIAITQSPQPLSVGPEHCNSQVTTLVAGKLCAHIFSTTVWHEFTHYEGVRLTRIWPPTCLDIDTQFLPTIKADTVPWLHEAIGRDRDVPERLA
jgi:hypothetical protein